MVGIMNFSNRRPRRGVRIKTTSKCRFYRKRRSFVNLQTSVQAKFVNVTKQVTEAMLFKHCKRGFESSHRANKKIPALVAGIFLIIKTQFFNFYLPQMNYTVSNKNQKKWNTMRKFGFKLYSTNLQTAPALPKECTEFASTQDDMFIELMIAPQSSLEDLMKLKEYIGKIEVRIHAPHKAFGFDAGNKELEKQNIKLFTTAQRAADIFKAETIVVHAGCGSERKNIDETVRQFKLFNDKRIVIENLPHTSKDGPTRHGNTARQIAYIMHETGCGFCFDFSHAVCAALSLNIDIEQQLKDFYALKPDVYHMCDGDITKDHDAHMHFQAGNYPLAHYLNHYTDKNAYITMETGEGIIQHNDLWIKDYQYLKSLQN